MRVMRLPTLRIRVRSGRLDCERQHVRCMAIEGRFPDHVTYLHEVQQRRWRNALRGFLRPRGLRKVV